MLRLLIPIAILAVLAVGVIALPASLVSHVLPPFVTAGDFSGTLWHGSAGAITVRGRDAGALEWRVHPAALLTLSLAADLHWVDVGFVVDGAADLDRRGLTARDVRGGGPVEDLSGIGVASGWRGTVNVKFDEIRVDFIPDAPGGAGVQLTSARGTMEVADLSSPSVAGGADLGGYALHVADSTDLNDTGGPVELTAILHFVPKQRSGTLSGTIKARPDAPPALRSQIETLGGMHAPDAAGRIPIELEFSF